MTAEDLAERFIEQMAGALQIPVSRLLDTRRNEDEVYAQYIESYQRVFAPHMRQMALIEQRIATMGMISYRWHKGIRRPAFARRHL